MGSPPPHHVSVPPGRLLLRVLAGVALALVVAEAGGQLLHRIWSGRWFASGWLASRELDRESEALFEPHPYLVAQPRPEARVERSGKVISTTRIRTRSVPGSSTGSHPVRIACLGGSTTFGTGNGDATSWPSLLQARLGEQFEVLNFGVPGYSTVEGTIQMALLVPEQNPDVVVFYEGWNDIRAYHDPQLTPDFLAMGTAQKAHLLPAADARSRTFLDRAARLSVVADTLRNLAEWGGWRPPRRIEARWSRVRPSTEPDPAVDRLFVRNLATMKALARRFGASSIFVPQVLNDAKFASRPPGATRGWTPGIQDVAMPALMRRFGELMESVCAAGESDCRFAGEILREPWTPADFVDDGHFSRAGGEKFADVLAPLVREAVARRDVAPRAPSTRARIDFPPPARGDSRSP